MIFSLKQSVRCPFFLVGLAIISRPAGMFHVELVAASVRTLLFMIMRAIIFSNRMHDRTNDFLVGPGLKPPALQMIFLLVHGLIP